MLGIFEVGEGTVVCCKCLGSERVYPPHDTEKETDQALLILQGRNRACAMAGISWANRHQFEGTGTVSVC